MAITDTCNTYYITTCASNSGWDSAYYVTDTYGDYVKSKSKVDIDQARLNELLRKEREYDAIMAERREIERASLRSGRMIAI